MTELPLRALGRLRQLARGGTATVFLAPELRIPGLPGERFVYKRYTDATKRRAGPSLTTGLAGFVRFRERLPEPQREAWDARIIWPVCVVVDEAGAADGVVMRLIPDRYFQDFRKRAGGVHRKPREIETLFGDDETALRKGLPPVGVTDRLRLVRAVAAAYGMMHKQGVVVGDISGRNIIYDPDPARPSVLVVDVDSARVKGSRAVFGMQPHTPNWQPPEALAASAELTGLTDPDEDTRDRLRDRWAIQSTRTDVYKFALMTVRILANGRGGAVSREPSGARRVLRDRLGEPAAALLDASLSPEPRDRPAMRDWYELLQPRHRAQPQAAARQVSGGWVWVDGQGWVRGSQACP
ncbi:hypothetical protein GCM10010168_03720 [Actinoplanes ianthinogenes]|uniref:Protein kinase domain-containing protein n=1 Tax=Actinoplanes ianthinogenes TaxID=122358 RepID=A0ABN6CFS1_9ACTN|nr:hypothetical protein [Actinoplanes ianthinogenes]BCJ42888.1 hypothetical protein Aiant_35450 [Actinoplanes ianthinogenes]GGQ91586.1 hypothetical protein GCM10010168_03720 [Actinoplanes ianthinogenes]